MERKRKSFQKHTIVKRVLAYVLAFAMVVTMGAFSSIASQRTQVKAADAETNVTMHFMLPNTWDWKQPAVQFWGGTSTVSGDTNNGVATEIPDWGGACGYFFTKGESGTSTTDYSLTVKGTFSGCQFLDFQNTGKTINPTYDARLSQYAGTAPVDVYYIQKDDQWNWYTDKEGTTVLPELPEGEECTIKVHYLKPDGWDKVYTQFGIGDKWDAVEGYDYVKVGCGAEVTADEKNKGWYSYTISVKGESIPLNGLFNKGAWNNATEKDNQTANFSLTITGDTEVWMTADDVTGTMEKPFDWIASISEAPIKPVDDSAGDSENDCMLTLNFKSTLGSNVESYLWSGSVKPAGEWPGTQMTATSGHEGWYTVHLIVDNSNDYECILHNKSSNANGTQLNPITLETKGKTDVEYWYDGTTLTTEKPADWKYTTTIHYLASGMGEDIYTHMWGGDSSIAGSGVGKDWPGEKVTANADHKGWYDAVYTQDVKTNFGCIFNNNNGTQTADIDVVVTSTSTELWVTGTKAGNDTTVYVEAPDTWGKAPEPYSFTMYYYNPDMAPEDVDKADLWIWGAGFGGGAAHAFTGKWYDADNDVTWFTQTLTTTDNQIGKLVGLKARYDKEAGWSGGSDSADRSFTISGVDNETWYYVDGQDPVSTKPTIVPPEKRYFVLDYENPGLYEQGITPQFSSWTTGYAQKEINFTYLGDGKWTVTVPVKASCTKVDFVIALDTTVDPWIKDGGDHSVVFPADQRVVYANMNAGAEPEYAMPNNIGYEVQTDKNQIVFYYRDDDAFVANTLKDMTVAVDVNGTEYAMTYNDTTKRFEYAKTGLTDGKTYYRYKVGENYVTDKFNENTETYKEAEYSYLEYYKLHATVSAEVMNPTFNYNENNVVKFTVTQDSSDPATLKVTSASIDASALGGSSKLPIEPELQAVTISATSDTTLGKKTLPITVTDQYGNNFTTSVSVEVVKREKEDEKDFDWDEAVIYFMLTDRFFDGNASNNAASGAKTYGDNAGLYHGGDFAGITAKLDYLQDLGVNTIWITPIVENIEGVDVTSEGKEDVPFNAAYHGYWASDFTKLNPTLGTTDEFKTMIDEAHKRGIRIMVDIVINHSGYGTEGTFGDMIRTTSGEGDILSSQSGLPDFATENADVRAKLVEWQTAWMKDYDIDYFRVDTVKHVESTTWAALKNSATEVNPSFKMIGEYYGAGYAANGNTLGTGQMDSVLDFDFNDQATSFVSGNIASVENFLANRNAVLNNTYMTGQFLSSHDENGFKYSLINNKKMSEADATAAALVAATLQITAKGQPVIYYGEEVGLTGANNYPYQTNRYDMDFTLATDDNMTYQHYKKVLNIRKDYSTLFARGDRKLVAFSDAEGYDVISRTYDGTTLYVGMNIKNTAKEVVIPVSEATGSVYTDLYSGKTYTVSADKKITVSIPAAADGGTVILKATYKAVTPDTPVTPENPDEPDAPVTPSEDDGFERYIELENGDFSEVLNSVTKATDGAITVVLPESTKEVPAEVFNQAAGKDITLTFEVSDKVVWTINAKSITNVTKPLDLKVTLNTDNIPAAVVSALAGTKTTMQVSLAHDGVFGFEGALTLSVGADKAGKYGNLYYYNPATGQLEYQQAVVVTNSGKVTYTFKHASEYVIVFDDKDQKPATTTPNDTPVVKAPETSDASPILPIAIVFGLGAAAVVFGVYRRKRLQR